MLENADIVDQAREAFAAYRGLGKSIIERMIGEIEDLRRTVAGERESRERTQSALRSKDAAMSVLFERMRTAGVEYSDLIP
jgi:hypothetical protein